MQTGKLKEIYTAREFHGEDGGKWYVLPGEMTAIDAIKLIADKLHISKDKVQETKGYVKNGIFLYLRKSWEKVPAGAADVWAMTVRR